MSSAPVFNPCSILTQSPKPLALEPLHPEAFCLTASGTAKQRIDGAAKHSAKLSFVASCLEPPRAPMSGVAMSILGYIGTRVWETGFRNDIGVSLGNNDTVEG